MPDLHPCRMRSDWSTVMTFIQTLNFLEAGLLALLGFGALAISIYFDGKRHHVAFLLFWSVAQASIAIDWRVQFRDALWAELTLDTVSNFSLLFAAFALFRGVEFDWNDRILKVGYALAAFFGILMFTAGSVIRTEASVSSLVYIAPNMLMSTAAFGFLAVGLFRELNASELRWAGVASAVVFCCYSVLQPASYAIRILDPTGTGHDRQVMRTLYAVGKLSIVVVFIAVMFAFNRQARAEPLLKLTEISLTIISIAVTSIHLILHLSTLSHP
jgi:hypothetical protein